VHWPVVLSRLNFVPETFQGNTHVRQFRCGRARGICNLHCKKGETAIEVGFGNDLFCTVKENYVIDATAKQNCHGTLGVGVESTNLQHL